MYIRSIYVYAHPSLSIGQPIHRYVCTHLYAYTYLYVYFDLHPSTWAHQPLLFNSWSFAPLFIFITGDMFVTDLWCKITRFVDNVSCNCTCFFLLKKRDWILNLFACTRVYFVSTKRHTIYIYVLWDFLQTLVYIRSPVYGVSWDLEPGGAPGKWRRGTEFMRSSKLFLTPARSGGDATFLFWKVKVIWRYIVSFV